MYHKNDETKQSVLFKNNENINCCFFIYINNNNRYLKTSCLFCIIYFYIRSQGKMIYVRKNPIHDKLSKRLVNRDKVQPEITVNPKYLYACNKTNPKVNKVIYCSIWLVVFWK